MQSRVGLTLNRAWEANTVAMGLMTFWPAGLPVGLSDRIPGEQALPVLNLPLRTIDIQVSGGAEVELQGCNGDPAVAGDWFTIQTVIASTVISDQTMLAFLRAEVTVIGTARVLVTGSN